MNRPFQIAAIAVFAVSLASVTLAQTVPVWPQARSDIGSDATVRFGVLANGMRYAIKRNATPAGQTSLRLRVGSGSLQESDAQQGLAHVLEHMSFKGSTHVPAGDMIKILQRKGLAFGPDTNAETEWTQTVYMLDLPRSDADLLDTGLMLMRETAGELTLDDKALTPERGVVLSEERLRDTPDYRAEKAQIDLMLTGQLAARRFPIGQVDVIEHAPISLLRSFYEANYRPDRTTLVAVGDFDPVSMEARIKARFSDWKPAAPAPPEPDRGHVALRGLTAKVVEAPGASTRAMIAWVHPFDAAPDTTAKRRRDTVQALALAILNRRLSLLTHSPHPPFLGARAGYDDLLHSAKVAQVEAVSAPDAWRPALAAIEHEVRRLVTYGVADAELAREITEMRAVLNNAVAGAATRNTPALASDLVEAVDEDEVYTDPATDLAEFETYVKALTPAEVGAAARAVFSGAGPLVELATPDPVAGGDAALAEVFAKANAETVDAETAQAAVRWPYGAFGAAGRVVERDELADVGAVRVRFANGVGLIVKPTAFHKDQILVTARIGGGRLALDRDHPGAVWAARALIGGGLKDISVEDSQRALAGRIYAAEFGVDDDAFTLRGGTQPRDFATQMSVLAAYVADPGYRPEAFERLRAAYLAALPQLQATPDGVLERDLQSLLHADDPRWAFPSRASLEAARPDDLKALLDPALSKGAIELTIVGDVTVDEAIAQVAATFGALPPRQPLSAPRTGEAAAVRFPAATASPVTRTDTGRPDQAMAVIAWPTTDFFVDMRRSRAAMLAGEVLQNRVLDRVRIAEGATYSPQTEVALSEDVPGYGVAISQVEMPPARIPGFFLDVTALAADMRDKGVTDDELARARNPRVAGIEKARLTNEYWLDRLSGAIADPRRLDLIRTTLPDYGSLTPSDIQAAARTVFRDDKAWRLLVSAGK
jgi:zinc protease